MAVEDEPMTEGRMLTLCASAAAKVARSGIRGATGVTMEEIVALTCLAACAGLIHAEGHVAQETKTILNIKEGQGA
ncbi:hypothetical protein [Sagittula sp. S175]|uniref:hypothetical protein n=1 Tax=Sagittula sp. S175 TaxID=3415129 RepID=UPI003C7CC478